MVNHRDTPTRTRTGRVRVSSAGEPVAMAGLGRLSRRTRCRGGRRPGSATSIRRRHGCSWPRMWCAGRGRWSARCGDRRCRPAGPLGRGSFDLGSQSPAYHPTDPANLVDIIGFRTLHQIAWADTAQADDTSTSRSAPRPSAHARLPALLRRPVLRQRLVIDIAHHW